MNSASIGIEIQNGGHDFGLPPYPDVQIEAVMALVQGIKLRHGLDKHHVIGHSDWAPARKLDPGEHFPWQRFADAGISLKIPNGEGDGNHQILVQTENAGNEFVTRAQIGLRKIGYGLPQSDIFDTNTKDTLIAFQRRFRQSDVAGNLDVETLAKIERLAAIVSPS
jgi:N-acetylmuramoyl-L-alanine amidase